MADQNKDRPITTEDEVDRTGRDEQVTGLDVGQGFAAGRSQGERDGLSDNDAPEGGVDSAEFPGAGAP